MNLCLNIYIITNTQNNVNFMNDCISMVHNIMLYMNFLSKNVCIITKQYWYILCNNTMLICYKYVSYNFMKAKPNKILFYSYLIAHLIKADTQLGSF